MVRSYMERPNAIILAVVSAEHSFAQQEVIKLAKDIDPTGERTLGVITKLDMLIRGSEEEASYLRLAQNTTNTLRLGWHVLHNESETPRDTRLKGHDKPKPSFFEIGTWAALDRRIVGAEALRYRISRVLREHALRRVPPLLKQLRSTAKIYQEELSRLGMPRTSTAEQRQYLLKVSRGFSSLISASLDGFYRDPFFGASDSQERYANRLRATIQHALASFESEMRNTGQQWTIVESSPSVALSLNAITRERYIREVQVKMKHNRGSELHGTYNPIIVGELFRDQCTPWTRIALAAKESIMDIVHQTILEAVNHVAAEETALYIFEFINNRLEALRDGLDQKVAELLEPHVNGNPITYNKVLLDKVKAKQTKRNKTTFTVALSKLLGFPVTGTASNIPSGVKGTDILDLITEELENMSDLHGINTAVDYMESYYEASSPVYRASCEIRVPLTA
ncbi:unnamed protein product [Parascedosporium putredinis]|uniref:Dynamin-type G domain-containing protein n=1 Tax=Parascedosporium putredinis TaxID=1442378 RepID=A0A9P1H0Q4_9PEZI|nr:unnamed protein product [Parascedosporium putredinis]CAI7994172.1 unnamed protein product [Parascedosporium putredinis]